MTSLTKSFRSCVFVIVIPGVSKVLEPRYNFCLSKFRTEIFRFVFGRTRVLENQI